MILVTDIKVVRLKRPSMEESQGEVIYFFFSPSHVLDLVLLQVSRKRHSSSLPLGYLLHEA